MKQDKNNFPKLTRRGFLNATVFTGAAMMLPFGPGLAFSAQTARSDKQAATAPKKPLVAYFSESGNTRKVAEFVHKHVGGDLIQIETEKAYPSDYDTITAQAKKEQQSNARPAVKTRIPNLKEYGVVFLGFPNWWGSMPMPVYTFIEENRLDGKTIAPFCTHGGGGLQHTIDDLKNEVPNSNVLKPLSVSGNRAGSAEKDVEKWLKGLGAALLQTTTGNAGIHPAGA